MIRKIMSSRHDPMGDIGFSEKIMLNNELQRDDDSS
jgi:hypothetical protein